jgi:hypothetical protein
MAFEIGRPGNQRMRAHGPHDPVIRKENDNGTRSKTVIHDHD